MHQSSVVRELGVTIRPWNEPEIISFPNVCGISILFHNSYAFSKGYRHSRFHIFAYKILQRQLFLQSLWLCLYGSTGMAQKPGLAPDSYCLEHFTPRAPQSSLSPTWYWGRNSAVLWVLSAYGYTQISCIQGLSRCSSSSHCHPSQPSLWWHLIAVTAQLGTPQILLKNVTVSVTMWETIPGAIELRLPTKSLWSWISDHSWDC